MTATPKRLLRALDARDGHRSAWTGIEYPTDNDPLVPQDRSNRGMGGFNGNLNLANYVWLESWVNGGLESNADSAAEARRRGIKISRYDDPATVPVIHAVHGTVYLCEDGTTTAEIRQPIVSSTERKES